MPDLLLFICQRFDSNLHTEFEGILEDGSFSKAYVLIPTIVKLFEYLKAHRKGYHTTLLMEGTLNQRLFEIDIEAKTMVETIISRLADERGVDEDLKARDMLRWVAEMNNIKVSAEEIVLREVVYV